MDKQDLWLIMVLGFCISGIIFNGVSTVLDFILMIGAVISLFMQLKTGNFFSSGKRLKNES